MEFRNIKSIKNTIFGLTGLVLSGCSSYSNISLDNLDEQKVNTELSKPRIYSYECGAGEKRKFYHIRQIHFVPGLSEDLEKKVSNVQKSIYNNLILPYISNSDAAFFDEGFADRDFGSLEKVLKTKIFTRYNSKYNEIYSVVDKNQNRVSILYEDFKSSKSELSVDEAFKKLDLIGEINESVKAGLLKLKKIEDSFEYRDFYDENPFLFGALTYTSIHNGVSVFPTESGDLNYRAMKIMSGEIKVSESEFNEVVLESREDLVFNMIDKYAQDKKHIIVNYGANHNFYNNIKKYNNSKNGRKFGKFCLVEVIPVGVDFSR